MVRLVVVEQRRVERVEGGEAGGGAAELGDGDGPVEGDHRVRAQRVELVVEGDDLRPVGCLGGGGVGVDGGDGRLDLERPGLVAAQAGADEVVPFGDERAVPPGAVLVGEADHRSVGGGAGRLPSLGEQHEREEADGFGLVGHELGEHASEADRLTGEVDAGGGRRRWSRCALRCR